MKISQVWDGQRTDDVEMSGQALEIREAFSGVTFVTADGERLSVTMRDNGFEVHYYKEGNDAHIPGVTLAELGFDAGWFRFNAGTVNDDKADPEVPDSTTSRMRMDAWVAATAIVDQIAEKHPIEGHRGASQSLMMSGPMITAAEQRVDLIMEVADWLLNKEVE